MRGTELLRLVWLNINQNKFKTIMTSIGIVVGAATIVLVIAIGRGGQMDVAEQFQNLNAGAIDVSYEWEDTSQSQSGGFSLGFFGGIGNMFAGGGDSGREAGGRQPGAQGDNAGGGMEGQFPGTMPDQALDQAQNDGEAQAPGGDTGEDGERQIPGAGSEEGGRNGGMERPGEPQSSEPLSEEANEAGEVSGESQEESGEETEDPLSDRLNQENIILTQEDVEDIETFVPGITGATISYTARGSVEGGNLEEAQTYTIAGVKSNYLSISNLSMEAGEFLTEEDDEEKAKVCVLGSSVAGELFGSAEEAWGSTIYIEDRAYTVSGVLASTQLVSAGISGNDSILLPYETGKKYITGTSVSPVITVVAQDVNQVDQVIENIETVLEENYSNAQFTYSDAGSQMEAAETSNQILTMLLAAMAAIVFVVGGIGIMNVLFVSVKERTNEIGILKAIGGSRKMILFEFLLESASISFLGGVLGVALSFAVTPVVRYYGIRVEANLTAWLAALGFALLTGTLFGIYPAWKASRLVPVEALNAE